MKPIAIPLAILLSSASIAVAQQPKHVERGHDQASRPQAAQRDQRPKPSDTDIPKRAAPKAEAAESRSRKTGEDRNRAEKRGDGKNHRAAADNKNRPRQQTEERERQADQREDKRGSREERRERKVEGKKEQRDRRAEEPQAQREIRSEQKKETSEDRTETGEKSRDRRPENNEVQREQAATTASRRDGDDSAEALKWDDDQRRRVSENFREAREGRRHYRDVGVEISLGRRLPREWEYYAVPTFVIEIAPRFRGYRYVWLDDRYVIVEPDSYEVVAYIDADSGRVYASSYASNACEDIHFTAAQRRNVLGELDRGARLDIGPISIGLDLPAEYELHRFPRPILNDYGQLEHCRYVMLDDGRVAVVAPESRRVVAVIAE
jgi:Protein of unknown function (DUF1236)